MDLLSIVGEASPFSSTGEGVAYSLRVRKITDPPLPRLSEHAKRVKYFSQLIEKYPKNDFYRFERGLEYYYLGQNEKALADLELASQRSPEEHDYHHVYGDLLVRAGRIEEGLAELEQSEKAYFASRFAGMSLLAYHLSMTEDSSLRDVLRAKEIVDGLKGISRPTVDSQLAQAAVCVELGETKKAAAYLQALPAIDQNIAPHQKTYRIGWQADAQSIVNKILKIKKPPAFTVFPLVGNPKTSTKSINKSGIGLTTNDPFAYRPDTFKFNFPELSGNANGKQTGYAANPKNKKVILNFSLEKPHIVNKRQPLVMVDLYGRRIQRKFKTHDNSMEVVVLSGKKAIDRKTNVAIPDDRAPLARCVFDNIKPKTKITGIRVIARPSGDGKSFPFGLQEIRAAAMAQPKNSE